MFVSMESTRFCPGLSDYMGEPARFKRVDPFSKNELARQSEPTRFQPASCNQRIFFKQFYRVAGLYLKIDFHLNEPTPSQPTSYNQALKVIHSMFLWGCERKPLYFWNN